MSAQIDDLLAQMASPALPNIDLSLDRMHALLAALGNPHHRLPPVIHVAGTNGKGSTIAFMKSVLEAAGMRVHRYTSPHLVRFHERIELCGAPVGDNTLANALRRVQALLAAHPVTFFEATTAAAFLCFSEHDADVLLLEVGLGGRLDATNVVPITLLSIITPIDYDHQDFLGNTLSKIASEKAGILRTGGTCLVAPQAHEAMEAIRAIAKEKNTMLHLSDVHPTLALDGIGLEGVHQRINATSAAAACLLLKDHFGLTPAHIINGIAHTHWPARLQRLSRGPLVQRLPQATFMLDGGHNAHAARALAEWLKLQPSPRYLWLGMRKGKDVAAFIQATAPHVQGICTLAIDHCPDAYTPAELAALVQSIGAKTIPVTACATTQEALTATNCAENATILIAGSLYLAGNILKDHG